MKLSLLSLPVWVLFGLYGFQATKAMSQCDVDVATSLVFSQGEPTEGYGLVLETVAEHTAGDLAGLTTYRLYMQTAHPTDRVIAAVGDDEFPLSLMPETSFYQNPYASIIPEGITPAFVSFVPDLAYDSWVTIGLDGASSSSDGEEGVTTLFAAGWESVFASGQGFVEDSENGSGWTVVPWTATNTLAGPEQRVLLAQLTTDGHLSGSMRVQVFPESDNKNDLWLDVNFDTNVVCGCTDQSAVNHNPNANANDGSCLFEPCSDEYACNFGESAPPFQGCDYPEPGYDCEGNCFLDQNNDGVCDPYQPDQCHTSQADVEGCPGDFKLNGYVDINDLLVFNTLWGDVCSEPGCDGDFTGDAEVDVNDLLDFFQLWGNECPWVWVPGDPCNACTDPEACNFSPNATNDDGSCTYSSPYYNCDGTCLLEDEDNDGICDEEDDCIGTLDDCGICNGPGPIYECGCPGISPDAIGVCGGNCIEDDDNNGVCDDQEVYGCSYPLAENFDPTVTRDNGSCAFPCEGDVNVNVFDWDEDFAVTIADFLAMLSVFGDVDVDADGLWDSADGCTDATACNYDAVDAQECIYPDAVGECYGTCPLDLNADGICDWNTCGDPVHYQGHYYPTVQIGEDCWFAENLSATQYRDGDPIVNGLNQNQWTATTAGAVATYGDSPSCTGSIVEDPWGGEFGAVFNACDSIYALNSFGRLYNGMAVQDARNVCPSGWKVPSQLEWEVLTEFAGLKASSGWAAYWVSNWECYSYEMDGEWYEDCYSEDYPASGNGNNSSGFNGSPGGNRDHESGHYTGAGYFGRWWSGTSTDSTHAWTAYLSNNNSSLGMSTSNLNGGFSVRCIQDSEE
jgi:uncharacterized protein (TIGR02145 family)